MRGERLLFGSPFFQVIFLRNLVPCMIWEVSGVLGTTFTVNLVVFRSVCLRFRRVIDVSLGEVFFSFSSLPHGK